MASLNDYSVLLAHLAGGGGALVDLPIFADTPGVKALLETMTAVAPAKPAAADEEWNPIAQRPHAPVPPIVGDELGAEITALKEAVDAFTTLCHEIMHVAVWEPFFAGRWRPKSRREFREFCLRAEAFCFFFADIVVSGRIRVRLPDGDFALERSTPSSARFAPVRAFLALKISDPHEILAIYLAGFSGAPTKLWQPRGTHPFAASLAAQAYDFYGGSLRYLDDVYEALSEFGIFKEFWRDFCGGETFLDETMLPSRGFDAYFTAFFVEGINALDRSSGHLREKIRARRSRQTRAYFALQLQSLLQGKRVFGQGAVRGSRLIRGVTSYLEALKDGASLSAADATFDREVRSELLRLDVWSADRRLILPRRAGGRIALRAEPARRGRDPRARHLEVVAYLVDELTRAMKSASKVGERAALLQEIQRVAAAKTPAMLRPLLVRPLVRGVWSVPLAAFDPLQNRFRELSFSYH